MRTLHRQTQDITRIITDAADRARSETQNEPDPTVAKGIDWPMDLTIGPGLEGAIACESKVGYVNGSKGCLVYRGYDIFDLCAHSSFEEVSYLLLHGDLPTRNQFKSFRRKLAGYRSLPRTMRQMMSFPVENMNPMAGLRLGTLFMRRIRTYRDMDQAVGPEAIGSDEDSIAMETQPQGEQHAIFELNKDRHGRPRGTARSLGSGEDVESCYQLIAGLATITAGVSRLRDGHLPIEPDLKLSHAANLLYMMTGKVPSPEQERVMDVALILHADHGMNASTFASMVVASTLSDIYFSVGSGIGALNGALHGGANERVLYQLQDIKSPQKVDKWFDRQRRNKKKFMGFGHRVYKAYDPRARVLGPLAEHLVQDSDDPELSQLYQTASRLEDCVVSTLGREKQIFPNVDFYSGLVYHAMGINPKMFTPLFAVSRVSGWTARVMEYLEENKLFRPRAIYTGEFDKTYVPADQR